MDRPGRQVRWAASWLTAIILMGTLSVWASTAAAASPPSSFEAARDVDKVELAAHSSPAALSSAAVPGGERSRRTEAYQTLPDPVGDVAFPAGDATSAGVELAADGQVTVAMWVSRFESPQSTNWQLGATGPTWKLNTTGAAPATFFVDMYGLNGFVYVDIVDADFDYLCTANVYYADAASRVYAASFDVGCLNNPTSVTWAAAMFYENVATAAQTMDLVPDSGVGPAVVNDGYVPVPACTPGSVPAPTPSTEYVSMAPVRLMDTRPTGNTIDCQSNRLGLRAAGTTTELQIAGRANVPANAKAAMLNVTVTEARYEGFITIYPCASGRPNASNVNYDKGQTVATAVVAGLDSSGKVCVYAYDSTHVVIDLNGYFPAASTYTPAVPTRILDTRNLATPGNPDAGLRGAGQTLSLQVGGQAGVPGGSVAVALNITVTGTRQPGYVTAYPCEAPRPNASNLNYLVGQNVPNLAIVKLGPSGQVCLFTWGATHLIVDVNGWFPAGTTYVPVAPVRYLETRPAATAGTTFDGQASGIGARGAGSQTVLQIGGRGIVPANATAVTLNLTVDQPTAPGFVAAYPCGGSRPDASNLNYSPGQTVANAATIKLAADGTICLFTYGGTQLVVDVEGYFTS